MKALKGECHYLSRPLGQYVDHVFQWKSDANGDVEYRMLCPMDGLVWRVITEPIDTPTANYDVYLYNEQTADVLGGKAADRSDTARETTFVYDGTKEALRVMTAGKHTFVVDDAGASKSGVCTITVIPWGAKEPYPL